MLTAPARTARSRLRIARIASSSVVLGGVAVGVLFAGRPGGDFVGSAVARLQLLPALLRWVSAGAAGAAVLLLPSALLLSAILFGRGYCSFLCPLGSVQDLALFLAHGGSKRRLRFRAPRTALRLATLAVMSGSWLFGSSILITLLDPYSLVHRALSSCAGLLRGRLTGLPASSSATHGIGAYPVDSAIVLLSALLLASVVVAAALKGRLFCNTLCPVGGLLSLVSGRSLFRLSLDETLCTSCGSCARVCPARCIDTGRKRVYSGSCVLCFSCLDACRYGALRYNARQARP